MNALPKSGVSSNRIIENIREYANHPANENKIIGGPRAGASRQDITLKIKEALSQEYGEKITSIAFSRKNQEDAIQHGISGRTIQVIFAKADFNQAKEFQEKGNTSLQEAEKKGTYREKQVHFMEAKKYYLESYELFYQLAMRCQQGRVGTDEENLERAIDQRVPSLENRINYILEKIIEEDDKGLNSNSEKMYDPKNLYTQPPLSQSERDEIISRQENHATTKQNEALSPIAETDETKGEDIVLSELDDDQSKRAVSVKKSEFGDIPTNVVKKSGLLSGNAKIFHDWQFLKLDIEEANDKSSNAWVQREFQKEYGDQDLSPYRRGQLLEPLEARRKEAEQRLNALNVQLSQLERAHPFLKAEQTQRKEALS